MTKPGARPLLPNWEDAFVEFKDGIVAVNLEKLAACIDTYTKISAEHARLLARAIRSGTLQERKPPRQRPSDDLLMLVYDTYYEAKKEVDRIPPVKGDLRSNAQRAQELARDRLGDKGHTLSVAQIRNYVRDARNRNLR